MPASTASSTPSRDDGRLVPRRGAREEERKGKDRCRAAPKQAGKKKRWQRRARHRDSRCLRHPLRLLGSLRRACEHDDNAGGGRAPRLDSGIAVRREVARARSADVSDANVVLWLRRVVGSSGASNTKGRKRWLIGIPIVLVIAVAGGL